MLETELITYEHKQTNKFNSLTLRSFFFFAFVRNKKKSEEYWLTRITDKLIMIGSPFIHMFTTSLGRHTQ